MGPAGTRALHLDRVALSVETRKHTNREPHPRCTGTRQGDRSDTQMTSKLTALHQAACDAALHHEENRAREAAQIRAGRPVLVSTAAQLVMARGALPWPDARGRGSDLRSDRHPALGSRSFPLGSLQSRGGTSSCDRPISRSARSRFKAGGPSDQQPHRVLGETKPAGADCKGTTLPMCEWSGSVATVKVPFAVALDRLPGPPPQRADHRTQD